MKTNLDLFKSAHDAARKFLDDHLAHTLVSEALTIFNGEGHDPLDWHWWWEAFTQQRQYMIGKLKEKTAAQIKADQEEAKKKLAQAEADRQAAAVAQSTSRPVANPPTPPGAPHVDALLKKQTQLQTSPDAAQTVEDSKPAEQGS